MGEGASVYILRCSDGSLYVGITRRSVEERVGEHQDGLTIGYTQARRPVVLLHSEHYERVDDAVAAERRIKGWSRAKKVAYMAGKFDALREFAVRRGKKRDGGASFDTGPSGPALDEGDGRGRPP
ncbi:GIY-YIG nuclease family protein [Lichenibacterium dinghuense]|uniref:GIY-YIG nuclease family protein n=1 Tax=Lichenibacterium dinghuense TaxID=2895977 RepID=UPI001F1BDD29|nr:GIY-YIG nuclease family protein [Lichenibacterium sp. 6Y81]